MTLDMAAELEKVHRLRRLLEPFAVLYRQTVLEGGKEPSEVRFRVQQSIDHLRDNYDKAETIPIFSGESLQFGGASLQVMYEVWQEARSIVAKRSIDGLNTL